jgi:uncharacterized protein DUF4347
MMTTRNIFFIDSSVVNYQTLIDALPADSEWFLLNPNQDGIEQIQAILSNYNELNTIQILSQGTQGVLYLGNTVLDQQNIDRYSSQLGRIGKSLSPSGNLLLYGCNGTQGGSAVQKCDESIRFLRWKPGLNIRHPAQKVLLERSSRANAKGQPDL